MRAAVAADVQALVAVINSAYRVEADFVTGDRIDADEVFALMADPGGGFIIQDGAGGAGDTMLDVLGVVYVRALPPDGYLGPLAVAPAHQNRGAGRQLVAEAERRCRAAGCRRIELTVATPRTELVEYYAALGYQAVGTEPYPKPERLREDVSLIVMSKVL
jgi:ribosomal protein S18 acetylase RimI-like enzyme